MIMQTGRSQEQKDNDYHILKNLQNDNASDQTVSEADTEGSVSDRGKGPIVGGNYLLKGQHVSVNAKIMLEQKNICL